MGELSLSNCSATDISTFCSACRFCAGVVSRKREVVNYEARGIHVGVFVSRLHVELALNYIFRLTVDDRATNMSKASQPELKKVRD